jgi:nitrogen regulatory protein PII
MMSYIHGKFKTPHITLFIVMVATAVIGAIGVRNIVGLTGITLASNLGTFILYGLTCAWTFVAFKKRKNFNLFKHGIIPVLGVIANVVMTIAILYLYIAGNADSKTEAKICFLIAGAWALISFLYVAFTTVQKTYNLKMVSAMIRPEQVNIVVEALKDENFIMGMTVTKVKGFGRQMGNPDENAVTSNISFNPKVRVDIVVREYDVPRLMDIIREAACTGNIGDGKIFVTDASSAMRIRTGEKGIDAL